MIKQLNTQLSAPQVLAEEHDPAMADTRHDLLILSDRDLDAVSGGVLPGTGLFSYMVIGEC